MKPIRLLIVDDHFFVRTGLRGSFEGEVDLEVCGEAATAKEAIELSGSLVPDLILLDLRLPDRDGLDVLHQVTARKPAPPVIVFSVEDNETDIATAVANGASGYLPK